MGMELIFEIRDGEEGGYCARALGHAIFTEGETWDELRTNVLRQHRFTSKMPRRIPASCNCITSKTS